MVTSPELIKAKQERRLVRFSRRFEDYKVRGYVLDVGPRFFLLLLLNDRIWFDGFECFRVGDVREFMADPHVRFAEAALRKREECRPRSPRVELGSIEGLLLTANRHFPVVTIHCERLDPEVCYIGRVLGVERGHVSLLEIQPGAIWDAIPNEYRLRDITRVSFGGDYEDALSMIGGDPRAANPAHALDGGMPLGPNAKRSCPAASDVRR
jgi:hypothetical protein